MLVASFLQSFAVHILFISFRSKGCWDRFCSRCACNLQLFATHTTLFQDASCEVLLREERPLKRHPHHPTGYKVPLSRAYQDLYNVGLAAAHVSTSSCWSPPYSISRMPFCKKLLLFLIHYTFAFIFVQDLFQDPSEHLSITAGSDERVSVPRSHVQSLISLSAALLSQLRQSSW